MLPLRLVAVGLTLAGSATMLSATPSIAPPAMSSDQAAILAAVSTDLNHRNAQSLASNTPQMKANSTPGTTATNDRKAAIAADDSSLQTQRDLFAEFGEKFTSFATTISVDSLSISGAAATASITEKTTMKRAIDTNGATLPDYSYSFPQTVALTKSDSTWQVSNISHDPSLQAADLPETIAPPADVAAAQKSGEAANQIRQVISGGKTATQSPGLAQLPMYSEIQKQLAHSNTTMQLGVSKTTNAAPSIQLASLYTGDEASRGAIVEYALKYSMQRNPNYKSMPDDCTNFVSQALVAGGWKQIYGAQNDERAWFGNNIFETKTWSTAQPMFDWGFHTAGNFKYVTNFTPGDITFWVWKGSNTFDHSTVVTYVDAQGQPYFSEHSNDHVNKSLAAILSENPDAIYSNWAP